MFRSTVRRTLVAATAVTTTALVALAAQGAVVPTQAHDAPTVAAAAAARPARPAPAARGTTPEAVMVPASRHADRELLEVPVPVTVTPAPEPPRCEPSTPSEDAVRITFDDGPGFHTEAILDILAEHCVTATFYVTGLQSQRYPEQLVRILAEGHDLGNHSLTHPVLSSLSRERIADELGTTQQIIEAATGYRPTAFRPPFGAVNGRVREVAAEHGLSVDLWTVDPRDWHPSSTADSIYDVVVTQTEPGGNVLLHVQHDRTLEALPRLLESLRARGLELG